jgi:Poly(hydroxyalcanoate) granule associated protein (phasin)
MATRKTVKKPISKVATRKPVARKTAVKRAKPAAPQTVANKVVAAGVDAAKRAQGEALRIYGAIAQETDRLTRLTTESAQNLMGKANVFVKQGQKVQSQVQAQAEAKAREVAKEVKAFAAKSQKKLKKNVAGTLSAANAGAKEGITRIEQVFEARVAKTLNTFGIPSAQNVRELQARMGELQKALAQLNRRAARI